MDVKKRKIQWFLLVVFFGLSVVLTLSAVIFYNISRTEEKAEQYNELSAISFLKKQQIEKWFQERQSDAFFFYYNPAFHRDAARLGKAPLLDEARSVVESWIYPLYKNHPYRSISLWDDQNNLLCIVGDTTYQNDLIEHTRNLSVPDTIYLSDLYFFNDLILMDLVSQIRVPGEEKSWKLLFHVDPFRELFSLIQSWPTPSKTAETLLLESQGDSVLYLNELRHLDDTALRLKLPGASRYTAPQLVVNEKTGITEGTDYRGTQVLMSVLKLNHRNWYLVSKVDEDEIFESIKRSAVLISVFTFILIIAGGGSIYIYYNHLRINQYREMFTKEQERAEAVERYETLTRFANDAIIIADEKTNIIEANLKAEQLFGYTKNELLTKSVKELRTSPFAALVPDFQHRAETGDGVRTFVDYKRKDGTVWTGDVSSKTIVSNGQKFFFGIIRDVTETLANRRRIEKLNRFNILLNEISELIVRVDNEEELLRRACETAVTHGGFVLVWIGTATRQGSLRPLASAGAAQQFLAGLNIQTSEQTAGRSQASKALLAGEMVYINNLPEHPSVIQWKERIEAARIGSTAGIPLTLHREGPSFISFYAEEREFFSDDELQLLKRLASNISFAVEKIHSSRLREKAEKESQISRKNYESVAANIPHSDVYLFDHNFVIQLADGSEMKKLGLGSETYEGKRIDELFSFEKNGLPADFFIRILRGDEMKAEIRIQNFVYAVSGIPVRDEDGELRAGIALITDISESKRAEEAIRASEEKHRNLINQLPDAVMQINMEGIITYASPAALELFAMTEENYWTVLFPALITGRTEEEQMEIREKISIGIHVHSEEKFRKLNGEEFYAEFSAKQIHTGVVQIVMRDITERRKNEELVRQKTGQLQAFFNSGNYYMGILELRGNDVYMLMVNNAYAEITGSDVESLTGQCTRIIASSEEEYQGWVVLLKQCRDLKKSINLDSPFPIAGDNFYVHASISQIEYPGRHDSFSFIAFDISDRIRFERELLDSQDSLHRLAVHLQNARENERIAIAREMHDELGQLLTAIKMNIAYLTREFKKGKFGQGPDEAVTELEAISSTVDKSVKGVRRLITKLRPEILDNLGLYAAIDWLAEDFRQKTGKAAEFINNTESPELGKDVSLALFRIVQECLTNVIKHAEADRVVISFSLEGNQYHLTVRDDGKGFLPDSIQAGKQFGLMGIKERMYIFGGEVTVNTESNKGTEVSVFLPKKNAATDTNTEKEIL